MAGASVKVSDDHRRRPALRQHNSCGNIATPDVLLAATGGDELAVDDDVFQSPPTSTARRRMLAARLTAAASSPSRAVPAAAGPWMRPRAGSSVAGLASTSPPQMTLRDIRKVTVGWS